MAMAMPWVMTLWMAKMVWIALSGWVFSCSTTVDEVAASLRSGDIGLAKLNFFSSFLSQTHFSG